MTRATMRTGPRVPAIAQTVTERAVAADEQRIAIELVDTVIRDLFGVGLTLHGALPQISGPAKQPVTAAIDGIDRIIRRIRDVVFDLAPADGDWRGEVSIDCTDTDSTAGIHATGHGWKRDDTATCDGRRVVRIDDANE